MTGSRPTTRTTTAALLITVALIAAVTLVPAGQIPEQPLSGCIICGPRGVADALLNTLLFLPLGFLLSARWRPLVALPVAIAMTLGIELAQTQIPGRDPSAGDVLFNSLGALLGVLAWHLRAFWLAPDGDRRTLLALAAAVIAGLVMFFTGWLLRPVVPPPPWYVEWQPSQPHFSWYNGRVLDAGIARLRMPPGSAFRSDVAAELLARGAPVAVLTVWRGPSAGLAPLVLVYGPGDREVVMLAVDRHDVVYRQRTRAADYRFTNPAVRMDGVLASLSDGDSVLISSGPAAQPIGRCFDVGRERFCGAGFTGASGWALLYAPALDATARTLADGAWLALLALPIGYWATPKLALMLALALGWFGAIRVPVDTVARPVELRSLVGLLVGVGIGLAIAAWVRSVRARTPGPDRSGDAVVTR